MVTKSIACWNSISVSWGAAVSAALVHTMHFKVPTKGHVFCRVTMCTCTCVCNSHKACFHTRQQQTNVTFSAGLQEGKLYKYSCESTFHNPCSSRGSLPSVDRLYGSCLPSRRGIPNNPMGVSYTEWLLPFFIPKLSMCVQSYSPFCL